MADRYPPSHGDSPRQTRSPQKAQYAAQAQLGHGNRDGEWEGQPGNVRLPYDHGHPTYQPQGQSSGAPMDSRAAYHGPTSGHSIYQQAPPVGVAGNDRLEYSRSPPQYNPQSYRHVGSPQSPGLVYSPSNANIPVQSPSYSSTGYHLHSPPAAPEYGVQRTVPPPIPPKLPIHSASPSSTYASYSQPAPQMASSFTPSANQLPYPDFDSTSNVIPTSANNFSNAYYHRADELNLPPASPPIAPGQERDARYRYSTGQYSPQPNPHNMPPPPPTHGSLRATASVRHPQARPLPGPPVPNAGSDFQRPPMSIQTEPVFDYSEARQNQLYDEVETAIMNASSPVAQLSESAARRGSVQSSPRSPRRTQNRSSYQSVSEVVETTDFDAEADAGLAAMRLADEQDAAEEARRLRMMSQPRTQRNSQGRNYMPGASEIYGGYGAVGTIETHYGPAEDLLASPDQLHQRPGHEREMSFDSTTEQLHARPGGSARVDFGGTGGLVDASQRPRRDEYDDEDAYSFTEDMVESSGPADLFFTTDTSSLYRPLPSPPSWSKDSVTGIAMPPHTSRPAASQLSHSASSRLPHSHSDISVPRFASLRQVNATPPVGHPARSKTDAEDRIRKSGLGLQTSLDYRTNLSTLPPTPLTTSMTIDLPSLPAKRFAVSKLGPEDFRFCTEPWALGSIYQWIRYIANPGQVTELKESTIREALIALFTHKVPTINIVEVEALAHCVIQEMYASGVLRRTEEWVRLVPGTMAGVLVQMTRGGCYAPTLHHHAMTGRCYASRCQRTLRKVDLHASTSRAELDWVSFYKLTKEDLEGKDKKEIERQNILHEIVQTEDQYMGQMDVLQHVYRDTLATARPAVIDQKRLSNFLMDVFGRVDAVRKANEDHLLAHLRYRQSEQGPWISGFSDIFRQWIRKARQAYIDYAAAFPDADRLVRQELERNLEFVAFLKSAQADKASNRLGLDTYLQAPIKRLQRYTLLLATVHKTMKDESTEKSNLQTAIDEIKDVTRECDARVAVVQRRVELVELEQRLILRPGMNQEVELNLTFEGRRLIHKGDLIRMGSTRFNWVDCHALLFDHYLVLAKSIVQRGSGAKVGKYDVSRFPIPMDLLSLESFDEDPVRQGHYFGALTATVAPGAGRAPDNRVRAGTTSSTATGANRPAPGGSQASSSSTPVTPASTVTEAAKDTDDILYPFKIRHLGRQAYTLFAPSAGQRSEWMLRLVEAKTKHAKLLHRQNSEPFSLRILADSSFYYDSTTVLSGMNAVVIDETPMQRAVDEIEARFKGTDRPVPVCRARINCATCFTTAQGGEQLMIVGTEYGVFVSRAKEPRGWARVITLSRITQVAALEEFGILLLISGGSLLAYPLEAITDPMPTDGTPDTVARRSPQKLSGQKEVGFFRVGRMKDRTLVFYKKRDALQSTFKVLEPVYKKSREKKRGIFQRGSTDYFREFDEFYIPTECSGMNLFTNSLAISTSRGFEVLTLDKKQPFSVPDLRAAEVSTMAQHIEGQSTLGMLRLSDQEFILCYEKCAVYINKYGDVSRSVIMNFVGKARSAALSGAYLLLFDTDFVEIRNAQDGRLKQIVAGRDVRCIDDGVGGANSTAGGSSVGTIKVAMAHPANERCQIVVELVLDQGLKTY